MTEILILDFNREKELKELLLSLKQNANFDKKVVVLNNGGEKYADKYKEEGLIDKVIHLEDNLGCALGTAVLFGQCKSSHAFYIQVDHILGCEINEDALAEFKRDADEYLYCDLAGRQCGDDPSERAGLWNVEKYLSIPKTGFGPGPWDVTPWSEKCIQDYSKENNIDFVSRYALASHNGQIIRLPIFLDNGKRSTRENPDSSVWRHEPDTKRLWLVSGPVKERYVYPKFTKEEWDEVLKTQSWPDGQIPENEREHSFIVPHWHE